MAENEAERKRIREITQRILLSRMRLMCNNGFFGSLLMHIKFSLDEEIERGSVDSERIYLNPDFVEHINDEELDYALMHLVLHVALKHLERGANLEEEIYWQAADIVVNSNIYKMSGCREHSISLQNYGGVQPHQAPDKKEGYEYSVDEVYQMLKAQKDNSSQKGKSSKSGKSTQSDDKSKKGSEKNNYQNAAWDDHSKLKEEKKDASVAVKWVLRTKQAKEYVKNRDKCIASEKNAGDCPGAIDRGLLEYRPAQTNWKQILAEFIQFEVWDYTFTPPDRRFDDSDFYLPDFNEEMEQVEKAHNVLFMIDTSGSMSDEDITACYYEVKGAIEQFDGKLKGWLGFFDAAIVKPKPFEDDDSFAIIKPKGGGGTSFIPIFNYVNREMIDERPTRIVILTDGYALYPDESIAKEIPVLWIINNYDVTPPWGKVARINSADD